MNRPDLLDTGPWVTVLAVADAFPGLCALHETHRPRNLALHRHHILPLGMGGTHDAWNVITACPTGHTNVHLILKQIHRGQSLRGGHSEKRIALLGYALWEHIGRPGGRVTLADDHQLIKVDEHELKLLEDDDPLENTPPDTPGGDDTNLSPG
jgi:hypothetical protein